jgi:predicted nucleic-acid-binding protein
MIGVDTNVLIRLFVADDEKQHAASARFFAERTQDVPAYVSSIVLIEFVWALTRTYNYPWSSVLRLIEALIDARDIALEHDEAVRDAVMRAGDDNFGLIDALIARANAFNGCTQTVTFDKKAAGRNPDMELLT